MDVRVVVCRALCEQMFLGCWNEFEVRIDEWLFAAAFFGEVGLVGMRVNGRDGVGERMIERDDGHWKPLCALMRG